MRWGYGRMVVTNTGAYRQTFPDELKNIVDPIGPDNHWHVLNEARNAAKVVFGCGDLKLPAMRNAMLKVAREIHSNDIPIHVFGITRNGMPRHPLYLKANAETQVWTPPH